jgi:hypothetical protein
MPGPLGDLIDFIVNFGKNLTQWYNDVLVATVQYMLAVVAPSIDEISTGFFSLVLGGTLGLANTLILAIVVVVAFIVLLTIKRDHKVKVSRTITSMIGLVLFAYLFYRGYAFLYNLQQILVQFTINFVTGSRNSATIDITNAIAGLDPLGVVVSTLFGWLFGWLAYAEAFGLRVMFLIVLLFYPVMLALRPLGGFFNVIFHAANAALLVVLLAPPFMAAFLLLPLWISNVSAGAGLMGGIAAFVGGLLAIATPIFFFILAMTLSNKVFGNIDAKVAGSVDIGSMPSFSMKDVNDSVHSSHMTPLQTPAGPPVSAPPPGSLMGDIKGVAVNAAAVALTSAGHPHVAAIVKAGDAAATRAVQKYKQAGGGKK